MQIVTPEGFMSYPNLIAPKASNLYPDKPARYSVDLIFPHGTDLTPLQNAFVQVAQEIGLDMNVAKLALKPCSMKVDKDTGQVMDIYNKGEFYLATWANETHPPQFVGPQQQTGYSPAKFRAGNKACLIVNIYAGNGVNKYVNASLIAAQWRGEGAPVTPQANLNLFTPAPVQDVQAPTQQPPANPFGQQPPAQQPQQPPATGFPSQQQPPATGFPSQQQPPANPFGQQPPAQQSPAQQPPQGNDLPF